MNRVLSIAAALSVLWGVGVGRSWALSPETTMLLDLLQSKGVITQNEAIEFTKTLEGKIAEATPGQDDHYHSVQSLADRVEAIEGRGAGAQALGGKVRVNGLIEAEMIASRAKGGDGGKSNSSDLSLATAQLSADAEVNQYVNGRLVFLYEEGENDDNIALDEAVIALSGGDDSPLYANVGRQYVPFGRFESHFITDPGTLLLGETNDTAVVAGYANETVDLAIGGFTGKVKEAGTGDHINSAVASATLTMPKSESGLALSGGVSFLSNLAASDSLASEATKGEVADTVGGWSAFANLSYADQFFFDAEYLGAIKEFAGDDFLFSEPDNLRPEAWNLEAAARIWEGAEFALRYGGSAGAVTYADGAPITAQDEYGAAMLYSIFDSTNLTIEYLYQKFIDASENSQGTVQLAIEF